MRGSANSNPNLREALLDVGKVSAGFPRFIRGMRRQLSKTETESQLRRVASPLMAPSGGC
jgi:hypothetical protein